jgi:hypothetical protein
MTASTLKPDETTERTLEPIASFESFAEAERAVDRLADEGFPVKRIRVVGRGLAVVDRVTGRRSFDDAAAEGAVTGAFITGFLGLLFGLFTPLTGGLLIALYGVAFGAAVGAMTGLLLRAVSGGPRRFSSARSLKADRYDVLTDAELVVDARARLAG